MKFTYSALKHGVTEDQALHVFRNAIRVIEYEYDGEDRVLYIGADPTGRVLEVVAVPVDDPARIIHADDLQPNRYHFLR